MISVNLSIVPGSLPSARRRFQRPPRPSPYVRLAQKLGYAKPKTARDNLARPYHQVATTNAVLRSFGLDAKVCELMVEVDASMLGPIPDYRESIHDHNTRDAGEDIAQADFLRNAGDVELETWIKRLAGSIRADELLLAGLVRERDHRRESAE